MFGRLVTLDSAHDDARNYLATVQLLAEHPKDAIKTLAPTLRSGDANVRTLQLAASAYEASCDTPQAVRLLREAIVADPRNIDLYLDFANVADWRAGLRVSSHCRILLSSVIFNRIKQHFELPKAELKITFHGFRFAVLHVGQVQHRCLGIEVGKSAIQRVKYSCEITLSLRYGRNSRLCVLRASP